MFKLMFIILNVLPLGCSSFKKNNPPKEPMALDKKLELAKEKRAKYCAMAKEKIEKAGSAVSRCDGLLFTALHELACGYPDLSPFESETDQGRWYRSPAHDCFDSEENVNNGADSDLSKDMIAGWGMNKIIHKDPKELQEFLSYASSQNNYFCKAIDSTTSISKCLLPPTTSKLFEDAIKGNLGLAEVTAQKDGFLAHLEVLGILTGGVVYGKISDFDLEKLQYHADREPLNALYSAAYNLYKDGDMNKAADILLDESRWPSDRLPNNHDDYCTDYLYQRDNKAKDWAPCQDHKKSIHDGTDFVFAVTVMLGEIR